MHKDHEYKMGRGFSAIIEGKNDWGRYRHGIVATPYCMVRVGSEIQGKYKYAYADFILKGRHYSRSWKRDISARGLAILANRFAREIAK